MRADRPASGGCDLCGRPLPGDPVENGDGGAFCCSGCAGVHDALGDGAGNPADGAVPAADGRRREGSADPGTVRTFLRMEGMHSATCEAFLEAVAESQAGVVGAEASYVTGIVRVDHDPGRTPEPELVDALSTAGYDAHPPEAGSDRDGDGGLSGERGMDDLLGFRYAAGVLVAAVMLLPYAALLYPIYFSSAFGLGLLEAGGGGEIGVVVLPLFLTLTSLVVFFTGAPLLRGAYVSLRMRRPTTDLLVTVTLVSAYLYSVVAVLVGRIDVYFDLTIVIAAGVVAATFYESLAKGRAVDRLTDLTVSGVDEARLYRPDGTTDTVPVGEVAPGDRVLVRGGERIPVDGVLDEGECTVDEAVVTGESLPVLKRAGDDLVGGSVVTDGAAVLRVGDRATSSIDRLTAAVLDIGSANHGVQRHADELASVAIPAVVGLAVLAGAASLALGGGAPAASLLSLSVLVAASPWAIGLATPLSVATSVEEALERGVVVFDETVFERLRGVDVVAFDKTGTLTTGSMDVIGADAPDDLLVAAAALERRASHPVADAIVTAFGDGAAPRADGGDADGGGRVEDFRSHATGVGGIVDGGEVLVGHPDLFSERGWSIDGAIEGRVADARDAGRLPIVVGRDGAAEGVVVLGDELREGWEGVLSRLGERGLEVVVLTGDDAAATGPLEGHPHVDHVFAGVPPEGKTATIRRLQQGGSVAMVGDGTNDAPALAAADLGVSLGGGTALASEAADVAIVDDDLSAVGTAFDLAEAARERVRRNNRLALVYNAIAVPLAALGALNPLFAMAAVVATAGLIAANSFRPLVDG